MSAVKTSDGGHWYTTAGESMHSIRGANGEERNTTLRDARKLNLLPSVTTVMKVISKPQLETWKQNTLIEAALSTPRNEGESIDEFAARISDEALSVTKRAADFGTRLHDLCEQRATGAFPKLVDGDLAGYIMAIEQFFRACGQVVKIESSVVGKGYAGRIDLLTRTDSGLVLWDFKTQKYKNGKGGFYDSYCQQLQAYRVILEAEFQEPVATANVAINSLQPQEFQLHFWSTEERDQGLAVWKAALHLWQLVNQYVPVQS